MSEVDIKNKYISTYLDYACLRPRAYDWAFIDCRESVVGIFDIAIWHQN